MHLLIEKYAGGRIPPLVAPPGQPPENGLLDEDFVKIFQQGFSMEFSISLGVLVAHEVWHPVETKLGESQLSPK